MTRALTGYSDIRKKYKTYEFKKGKSMTRSAAYSSIIMNNLDQLPKIFAILKVSFWSKNLLTFKSNEIFK